LKALRLAKEAQASNEVPANLDELWRFDSSPAAPLASHDFISLLESAFSFAIFARLFLFSDALPHSVLTIHSPERAGWASGSALARGSSPHIEWRSDLSGCPTGDEAEAVGGLYGLLAEAGCRQLIPLNSGFAGLWAASHECSGLVTGRTFPPIFVYQTAYDKDLWTNGTSKSGIIAMPISGWVFVVVIKKPNGHG
jgi:hypothetical protein